MSERKKPSDQSIGSPRTPAGRRFLIEQFKNIPSVARQTERQALEYMHADRFAARLLMTMEPEEGATTGEELFDQLVDEFQAQGMRRGLSIIRAIPLVADAINVPESVVRWFHFTRNDKILSEDGRTPREWLLDIPHQEPPSEE